VLSAAEQYPICREAGAHPVWTELASGTKMGARKIGIRRKTGSHPKSTGSVSDAKSDQRRDDDGMAKSSQAVNK
jgi:hypothetical protein